MQSKDLQVGSLLAKVNNVVNALNQFLNYEVHKIKIPFKNRN